MRDRPIAGFLDFKNKPLLKRLLFTLKLLLTGYILWQIFGRIALADVLKSIAGLPLGLVIILLLLSGLRHLIQYRNWHHALSINPGFSDGKRKVLVSYFAGLALRFLIPGGAASAGKVLYVDNSSRWASIFSFGAERAFLTWATWCFAFGAGVFYFSADVLHWIIAGFVLTATAPLWAYWLLGTSEKTRTIMPGYRAQAPKLALLQIVSALVMHLQYWLVLMHGGVISFGTALTRMSLTNFSNSIPITFAGLGLRESFAIHFLSGTGFSAEQAVAATLTVFIFQDILPGLIGAVTMLAAKKRPTR